MTASTTASLSPAVAAALAFRLRVLGNAYFSVNTAPDSDSVAEFHRMFKDPLTMPCPPWQSASDSRQGAVSLPMGLSARQALAWYRRFDFEGVGESDQADHIGNLLTFAGVLLETGADPDTLQHYAHDHLLWIPAYCECLAAAARTPYYRELAEETRLAVLNYVG
jgi:TorA maturation chaperone TorD